MALEKDQSLVINLGEVVNTRLTAYSKTVTAIRAKQDADFSSQVTQEGLSNAQQASYWQAQLDKEKSSDYPDETRIQELQTNVDNQGELARYQKYQDKYNSDFDSYKSGKESIDQAISDIQDALSNSNLSQDHKDSLQSSLTTLTEQKFSNDQQIIQNNITLATNDQSVPVLNSILQDLQDKQMSAQAGGDSKVASDYGVQIQGVKSSIATVSANKAMSDMSLKVLNSGSNSVQKLSMLSDLVGSADSSNPVNIGGTIYPSAQAYWQAQQNSYISGNGSGIFKDFMGDLSTEINNKVTALTGASKNGALSVTDMLNVKNIFTTLSQQQNIQPYLPQLTALQTSTMSNIAITTANAILDEYDKNIGTEGVYKTALNNLDNLQQITGIDQTSNINKLQKAEATNTENVISKESATNDRQQNFSPAQIAALKENGVSDEDIGLMQLGKKAVPSTLKTSVETPAVKTDIPKPTDVPKNDSQTTTQPPVDLNAIQQQIATLQKQADALRIKQTTQPTQTSSQPTQNPVQPTQPVSQPIQPATTSQPTSTQQKTYTVVKGDTLSAIAQKFGTTVDALAASNKIADKNKIQIGQQLTY